MLSGEKKPTVVIMMVAIFMVGYGALLLTGVSNIRHLIDDMVAAYFVGMGSVWDVVHRHACGTGKAVHFAHALDV